jgi:hypothetical protein
LVVGRGFSGWQIVLRFYTFLVKTPEKYGCLYCQYMLISNLCSSLKDLAGCQNSPWPTFNTVLLSSISPPNCHFIYAYTLLFLLSVSSNSALSPAAYLDFLKFVSLSHCCVWRWECIALQDWGKLPSWAPFGVVVINVWNASRVMEEIHVLCNMVSARETSHVASLTRAGREKCIIWAHAGFGPRLALGAITAYNG